VACAFVGGTQGAAVNYPAAGGAALISTTLFKVFLVEARNPAILSYADILTNILTRTNLPVTHKFCFRASWGMLKPSSL
jgi:hypothetical protein